MATKVLGVNRLTQKLRRFPEAVREEIRKAMEVGATEIVTMMKRLVPVDQGDLRDSIGWTWGAAPEGFMVIGEVQGRGYGDGNLRITIYAGDESTLVEGARVYFQKAMLVEFGTRMTKAQPFFFVSYRALRRRSRSRITRAVNKAAKSVAGTGGK